VTSRSRMRLLIYRLKASVVSGTGKLKTAGGISGAMKESVQRAFSYSDDTASSQSVRVYSTPTMPQAAASDRVGVNVPRVADPSGWGLHCGGMIKCLPRRYSIR
jgi:ATP-dependent Lon protease